MRAIADPHLALMRDEVPQTPEGCAECLRLGSPWAHLRLCLTCGHLRCRDSSPLPPARSIVRSFESGESRRWSHADDPYV
ncbi:MAG TPA: hypothetical protein VK586_26865 [Streptosporangiaceae bacterium]|nr:hypothetical protein [Streptosporangiaceae bacterium]